MIIKKYDNYSEKCFNSNIYQLWRIMMKRKHSLIFHQVVLIALLTGLYQSDSSFCDEIFVYKTDASNNFTHVAVENNNSIWFGAGATVFRLNNFVSQSIRITEYTEGKLYGISSGQKGIYFAYENFLSLFSGNTGVDYIFPNDFLTDNRNTASIITMEDGSVLYGCDQGLLHYNGDSYKIIKGPSNPDILYYPFDIVKAPDGSIWLSRLAKITHITEDLKYFEDFNPPAEIAQAFRSIAVDNNSSIWIGTDRSGLIIRYMDNEWDVKYRFPNDEYILDIKIDSNNILWAGTQYSGLLRYDGISWKSYTTADGLPSNQINEIAVAPDNTKWIATPDGLASLIDKPVKVNQKVRPQSLVITSTYPNPFNACTTITFVLPLSSKASLSIYSLSGQKIRTLFYGSLIAGTHSILWDGLDDYGKVVSSGVYFSKLDMGKKIAIGKMLLLK
jgi:streptogramin lyase